MPPAVAQAPVTVGPRAGHSCRLRGPFVSLCADGSDARVVAQVLHPVRSLPGEFRLAPAEVAIGGRLLVDGATQVEVLDDARGGEVKVAADHLLELGRGHVAR